MPAIQEDKPQSNFGKIVFGIIFAVFVYLILALWAGWSSLTYHLSHYPFRWFAFAILLSTFNFFVRFVRYRYLLFRVGIKIPFVRNLMIHFAGFSLTMTPGKAGEAIKSWFLKRDGYSPALSLPAVVVERISDLIAVLGLASVGVLVFSRGKLVFALSAILILGILFFSATKTGISILRTILSLIFKKHREKIDSSLLLLKQYMAPAPLTISIFTGILGWGAEAFAFYLIANGGGITLNINEAFFIYSISTLAGVVFPGGLGGMEGMMGLLLASKGNQGAIVSIIFLIRLATLWWATIAGLIAMVFIPKK